MDKHMKDNDKKLELDEIITLNNDLNVGEIIECNPGYDTEYGKILFFIYISSLPLIDDKGNAIPILGENDLPTLELLAIHDTGRITRIYSKTAKNLYLWPDIYKITHKLIQDNPELLENYPGLLAPVPENERRQIIRFIEEVKSEQQPISQSQKLPKGGRKKKRTSKLRKSTFTPLRIYPKGAHGNCYFALINRPRMGDLIVQRCKKTQKNRGCKCTKV